jgi:hypothetical protein
MKLETAKHLIKGAIAAQRAAGVILSTETWGVEHAENEDGELLGWRPEQQASGMDQCCALGCLVLQHNPRDFASQVGAVQSVLGWEAAEVRAFTAGFDGQRWEAYVDETLSTGLLVTSSGHFQLGQQIAAECGVEA